MTRYRRKAVDVEVRDMGNGWWEVNDPDYEPSRFVEEATRLAEVEPTPEGKRCRLLKLDAHAKDNETFLSEECGRPLPCAVPGHGDGR